MNYTESWINANTGELEVREPYKVIHWVKQEKKQMSIPFVAFGNDELARLPVLGDKILCPHCGQKHKLIFSKRKLDDGTEIEDRFLAAYKCRGKLYLAGVNGKDVTKTFRRK